MEETKREKQRFQFSVLALVNGLVAIIAVTLAGFSAARVPAFIPTKPGLETQLRGGVPEPEVRKTALALAEGKDRAEKEWRTALWFQQLYAWLVAALLITNTVVLLIFFRRLRGAQKREAAAYLSSAPRPENSPPESS